MILAEIGAHGPLSLAAHLASWAGICPGNYESAGKHTSGKSRPGDPTTLQPLGTARPRRATACLGALCPHDRRGSPHRSVDGCVTLSPLRR
ncbi:transposase [Streptomyces sp. NPDC093982]|uniref:transposase n=1 Tax=Streptomyces sp. NPDC093982 TaxID=3155077 RepID=UPI003417A4F1